MKDRLCIFAFVFLIIHLQTCVMLLTTLSLPLVNKLLEKLLDSVPPEGPTMASVFPGEEKGVKFELCEVWN